ncbi:MAG: FGGY-family carbohydrate kinase [Christensenella sp.]|nr:FGGY-family carbohydrate kinase [Christensenella sp.]
MITIQQKTAGEKYLGIELGSTRIKSVLIDGQNKPIASGSFEWKNKLEDGVWTYSLEDVWKGIQHCYDALKLDYKKEYGTAPEGIAGIGISAMMHGYLPFDEHGNQLAAFRTWRNTTTEEAAKKLTELFDFNIPQRWSIAHLYQAMLNGEKNIPQVASITTLSGYVHRMLTGKHVLGIGDASGMFPVDSETNDYREDMAREFDRLVQPYGLKRPITEILPKVLLAGDEAGALTPEGALLIDPSGDLPSGIPLCPPEGDAGTGMVATNSVTELTGNVSAGTSVFAMIVLQKQLSQKYVEIDMVTTPDGKPVAMVHCNNFVSDLDAWMKLFRDVLEVFGVKKDGGELYGTLYRQAMLEGAQTSEMVAYNYFAGEPITDTDEGRPLFARMPDSEFTLPNFMRTMIFSALGTLALGMRIITEREKVKLNGLMGHGGFFKTKGVGQDLMAAALGVPVSVMESAGEGGAWGIALLAGYRAQRGEGQTLPEYLQQKVFDQMAVEVAEPKEQDMKEFEKFMRMYEAGIAVEKSAIAHLKEPGTKYE